MNKKINVPVVGDITNVDKYVNIVLNSNDELGRMLANGYPTKFDLIFGTAGSVRNAIEYVRTPGYPVKLLSKSKLSATDINKIPKKSVYLPNYYAVVAYVISERVKQDNDLIELLKNNDKILTSYYTNTKPILGNDITVVIPKHDNAIYVKMYTQLEQLIKENKFDDDNINKFITEWLAKPDEDLFAGAIFTQG